MKHFLLGVGTLWGLLATFSMLNLANENKELKEKLNKETEEKSSNE